MTNKQLIKYCFCILIMVAISTFMINLISNPGEYLAKLQNVAAIRGFSNYQYKTYGQKPLVSFTVEESDEEIDYFWNRDMWKDNRYNSYKMNIIRSRLGSSEYYNIYDNYNPDNPNHPKYNFRWPAYKKNK